MISAADDTSGEARSAVAATPEMPGQLDLQAPAELSPPAPSELAEQRPETGELDRERLAREPVERRRTLLEPWLRQLAAAALGVGAARLDAAQPLSAYGLDSLAAVEIQSRLQTALGVEVGIAELLAGASLDDLAAVALAEIDAAAEGAPEGGSEGSSQVGPEVGGEGGSPVGAGGTSDGARVGGLDVGPRSAPAPAPAAEGPATGRFPLAPNQQALWFIHRLAPQGLAYHLAGAARVESPIDRAALGRALAALVQRHPALRTSFAEDGEGPWQEVGERGACELVELAAAAPDEDEVALVARLRAAAWRPFDLERGPLLRVGLLPDARPGAASAGLLFLAVHHIVADFWSLQVMVRDLGALYAQERREHPEPEKAAAAVLPPLGLRYTDFARWQRRRLAGGEGERLWHHWREALGGAPPARLALPVDRPWPRVQTWPGAAHELVLPEALTVGLESVARAGGATLFMVLLAGFQALLARTTGAATVAVGSPTHGRSGRGGAALADLVGYFVNLVPLVAAVDGDTTFAGLVAAVRATALAAYEHQEMPLAVLAERLLPERDPARSPLFDVVFAFEKGRETRLDLGGFALGMPGSRLRLGEAVLSSVAFPPPGVPFALSLVAAELGRGLGASLRFNTDLFDRATVVRLAERFRRLLAAAAAAPGRRLSELPLLAPAERHQLLAGWNDTARDYPRDAGLAELFAAAAARAPEVVAVVHGARQLTYGELGRRADELAGRLASAGVGPEVVAGVRVERSPELVVALLGVLAAGGAYLPLDPSWPAERQALVLAGAGAVVLVTDAPGSGTAGAAGGAGAGGTAGPAAGVAPGLPPVIAIARGAGVAAAGGGSPAAAAPRGWRAAGDSLACVMVTSGSTGEPKGVAVVQRAVARLVLGAEYARFGPEQVWLQLAPAAFDASTLEIWGALLHGARLVIYRPRAVSPEELGEVLAAERVSSLWLTAGLFHQMVETNAGGLAPVGQLLAGGDVLAPAAVAKVLAALPGCRLINGYGPTEGTTFTCCQTLGGAGGAAGSGTVPIGRPIANTRAYLLDAALQPVPVGVAGELYAGGDGLARGYHRRPELTAERFVPDPCGGVPGGRLYRTGDRGRYLADGRIEFLGRTDAQVKVRGFRVEPGEIEAALASHPAVAAAAVIAVAEKVAVDATAATTAAPPAPRDTRLVAYVVGAGGAPAPGAEELRAFLRRRLPEPLLPSAFVPLPALPLTANGKLDRRALPAPRWGREAQADPIAQELPRSPVEELLAGIWREVLGVERVGLHDNFFALGGHSLLAARLMSRVRRAFGVELPLAALFEEPTLAGLAARLAGGDPQLVPSTAEIPEIGRQPRPDHPPLSFAQERLWFLDQLEPAAITYNVPAALRLHGELAWTPLAGAITAIVARHEALRTRFPEVEGQPVQRVEPPAAVPLPVVDLAPLGAAAAAAESARLAAAEAAAPFALAAGPLLRARLLALGAGEWLLLLSFHHIAFDGASVEVFWRELGTLYAAIQSRDERRQQAPPALPPLPIQYLDYALWQRRRLSGPALAPLVDFWRQALAGAPPSLALSTDRPRPAVRGSRGDRRLLPPAPGLAAAVAALARRQDATSFMVLLAAWAALLGRAGGARGQGVVVVGMPVANRDRLELEPLIGFFVNTLPVPIDLAGDPAFGELLGRVRQAALAAYAHQELPFEKLVEKLSPERDPSSTPLFQVALVFRDREAASPGLPGVRAELLPPILPRAKFDLALELASGPQGLGGDLEYSTELFDAATAERLLGQFTRLLAAAAAGPELRLSELPLLAPAERHQLLAAWNDTAREYPRDASLAALFAAAAAQAPEAVAVVSGERQLSYGELGRRADALAERLGSLGVGPEVVVGVCLERSPELVVALLGVLKAGGAYLPLEPAWPAERLALLLAGAGAPVLVTDWTGGAAELAAVADPGSPVVVGVAEQSGQGAAPAGRSAWRGDGDCLAYVIFTSGSTGEPKGVAVVQRGVARLVLGTDYARFGPEQVWLQLAPTAFDLSTLEVWGPLLNGGRLVIYPPGPVSPEELGDLLAAQQVSSLWLTAGLFHQMAESNVAGLAPLEQLLAGGDVLSPSAVTKTLAALPGCRLIDGYGPTEVTTFTCCQTLGVAGLPATVPAGTVPIGRPIANTRAYLLDAALQPVPVGVVGELYAGGDGLARGYHRRPELTAERFVPDPCGGEPGGRLYRTGDLARHLADGRMEFLGRIDAQVKVRGVRVEPAEVEAVLARHPALAAAAVVATTRPSAAASSAAAERWLVAYVVAAGEGQAPAAEELRAFLRRRLPEPMVPSAFVPLAALPLTANGKLDRRALPAPSWGRDEQQDFAGPRTPAEELLAGIWREVLEVERVGLHDSFFALGGHSLLAARLMSRVRRAFGVELPLGALFAQPTLAGLAARLAGALAGGEDLGVPAAASGPIEPCPRPAQPPLSFAQERLWYLDQLEPASVTYNVPAALRLRGDLAWAPLAGAITAIVARHEALRTRFPEIGGQPVQRVEPPMVVPLPVVDLARLPAAAAATESARLTAAEAAAPFALAAGPLLRARLLAVATGEWLLLLSFHHIVFDGVSVEVFWRELGTLYAASRSRGSEAPAPSAPLPAPPPLPIQYLDYTLWQRQRLVGPVLEPLLAFWRQALAEAPPALAMATDRPRPAVRGSRGGRRLLAPAPGIAEAVAALAQRTDATSFMVLLAAWAALLGRAGAGAQSAVVVGSPVANRDRLELEPLIGFFVNALPLPIDLAGDPTFGELLGRVRWVALAAYAHQELPFERMVQELAPQRDPGATPLFQAMLAFREREAASPGLPGVRAELLPPVLPRAKFDLTLSLAGGSEGLAGDLEYSAELFDAATAERLLGHFSRLLAAAVAAPERRLSELPLMAPAERHQLLWGWNDVSWDYPRSATMAELFAATAAHAPDAVALVMEPAAAAPQAPPEVMTYGELDRAADRLANHLVALGVRAEDRVAVCLPRSRRLIVALLACVKTGAGYVPLDPSYPEERLAWLLADSGAAAVVTAGEAGAALPADGCARVDLDRLDRLDRDAAASATDESTATGAVRAMNGNTAGADGLFCLLYTSGSTGTPKGVALVHRGVARLALGRGHARLGPERVFAHLAPITFDAATFEIWCALANGSRLVILPPGVPSLDGLGAALARHRVTTLFLTTALFHEMVEHNLFGLAPVEELLTGGDVVSLAHFERAAAALPGTRLIDGYGPTEDTTFATCWPVVPGTAAGSSPIGRPVAGTEVYVLDRAGELLPPGSAGELALAGDALARGYWNRPALTAERFRPHPFSRLGGERVYLTGDSVRHRPDGNLQFLGRIDRQVKVRGFRVEPGEIEAALATHPGVAQSIAMVREDRPGDKRLVAYVVPRAGESDIDAAGLSRHLASYLPAHLLPTSLMVLASLPVTRHGKVDRQALPAPRWDSGEPAAAHEIPRTPAEQLLAGIWEQVLGVERVGLHDNFFALGGHSLLAARLMSQVRRAFEVELPLAALFEAPTLAGLAARLAGPQTPPSEPGLGLAPRPRPALPPLSFAQERLWFLDRLEPASITYNIPAALRLRGPLAWAPLAGAINAIVARHEALRTHFPEVEGRPVQQVEPPSAVPLPVVDLAPLGAVAAAAESLRLAAAEAAAPFALAAGPLLRVRLLALGAGEWLLLLSFHHIVFDGASVEVFWRELGTLYAACQSSGCDPLAPPAMLSELAALPPLPIQYLDYALWQRRRLAGPALAALVAFWRQALAGAPPALALPTDRPRPVVRGSGGGRRLLRPEPGIADAVAALARRRNATSFMVLLAAWAALLGRAGGGAAAVVVGLPVANRDRLEIEPLIGFFVNAIPLHVDLGGDPAFGELLARVRRTALTAYAHQELPFEKLVEELAPQRDTSLTPLFQVVLAFRDREPPSPGLPGVSAELLPPLLPRAKFDLALSLANGPEGLGGDLEYSAELFDATTAERLLGAFSRLLAAAVAEPEQRLAELPLLAPAERHQLVQAWNDVSWDYPRSATMAELLAATAARAPEAVALVMEPAGAASQAPPEVMTYGELDRAAGRLARHLAAIGVRAEDRVAVCLPRSPRLIVALLACVKAGAGYVPLDPAYPAERLAWLLADSGAAAVVTAGEAGAALPAEGCAKVDLDHLQGDAAAIARAGAAAAGAVAAAGAAGVGAGADRLFCLLYTSGSTGTPKAVALVHRGVARLALGGGHARLGPDRVLAHLAPITFDAATFEIWCALANGARLVILPPGVPSLDGLGAALARHRVTTLFLTTALFHEMVEQNLAGLAPVEELFTGGDVVSLAHLERAAAALPGTRLFDAYGPTEDTTYATCWPVVPGTAAGSPPIGRPVAATEVYVLDRAGGLVPQGFTGELAVAGDGLARGYWNRPALTAERFRPHPFSRRGGERVYLTGDSVRHRPDGNLQFLGRVDRQVKVRGFRVEPGEIEAALATHPQVAESIVVVREDRPGDKRLVAYAVPRAGDGAPGALDVGSLRRHLAARLPAYMLPSSLVLLSALPVTAHGKVDRQALPAPAPEALGPDGSSAAGAAPATPLEEIVAGIFAEVLGVEPTSVHDSFFDLGGHSLLATRLASRVRATLGLELPIRRVFELPTVAGLAGEIERLQREAGQAAAGGPPAPVLARRDGGAEGTPAVLSFSQERLWFLDRFEPGSLLNMPAAVRLSGELDLRALGAAVAEIVRRHQVLRTGFVELADGRPAQVVQPWRPQCLRLVELSALAAPARQAEAQRLARAEAAAPFDLRRGPMLRATLLRLGPLEHGVLLTLHHIAADGWSVSLLRRELGALYEAFAAGRVSPLPELELQYADFAQWQREWLTGAVLAEQSAYWRQALAGPPAPLELPTDRLRPAVQTFTGGERWLRLPAALSNEVKALGRRRGATLFMTLLAAVEVVFGRWSGQDEVVVGTPIAGRNRAETEPLIGLFLNHLVLRTDLSGDPSFGGLLGRLRETTLGAFAHQDLPFEKLLEEIKPERDLSRTPLFQVLFNLINVPMEPLRLPGLTESPLAAVGADSKFDMTFYVEETGGEVAFHLVYNADLFDGGRMVELLSQIEGVLAQAVADPELPLGSLSLLTAAAAAVLPHPERALGATWQGAFHEQFAAHARRLPGKLAVSDAAGSESGAGGVDGENGAVSESGAGGWTYAELDAESNRLAHWLLAGGIAKGDVVAIHAHRGAPLVVAVIGVLKAGGVFLLLDPAYPPRRQAELLGLAGARAFVHLAATGELPEPLAAAVAALPRRLTLGEAGGNDRPSAGGVGASGVSGGIGGNGGNGNGAGAAGGRDGRLPQLAGWPATDPGVAVGPDDPCVLTFTSGSTGVPKGVLGRHGSLAHFAPWAARRFGLSAADRSAMTSGLAHDPMQRDICVPLQLGATLCIPDPVALWSSGWLAGWLRRAAITFVNLTPAMVQLLTERGPGAGGDPPAPVPSLRHAFLVGDVLTRRQVERLVELAPAVTCVNLYGSTEGQRAVSYHVTSPASAGGRPGGGAGFEEREVLPLGRGIDEVELLVLDRQRRVAGIGELGELAIRSHHLALGYLGDPAQTAQRFVVNPGTGLAADRIYLTGDLGRYLPDGEAEFVARADNQVKIRGFRIEPAEIEMALARHPGLREAAVIARADRGGDKRLVAYVVAAAAGTEVPAPSVLQDFLRLALPEYMVPGAWVTLPALPLTANGKLDRRALPEPASAAAGDEAGYVAPATAAELAVAEIWQEVLGVERVGVHDKFFHLGGHSLLLVRVQGRLAERFGKPLSILDLFKYPDVASLARFLAAEPAAAGAPEAAAAEEPDAAREQQLELGKTRRRQRLAMRGDPDPAAPAAPAGGEI